MNIPKYIADYAHMIWNEVKNAPPLNPKVPFNPPKLFMEQYKDNITNKVKSFQALYKPGMINNDDLIKVFDVQMIRYFDESKKQEYKHYLSQIKRDKKNDKEQYHLLAIKQYMLNHPEFEFELSNDLLFYVIGLEWFETNPHVEQAFLADMYEHLNKTLDDKLKSPSKIELMGDEYLEYTLLKEYADFGLDSYSNKLYDFMIVNQK